MSDFLLTFAVLSVPVLAIVGLAMAGRRLTKSCGGTRPDGSCERCGAPPDEASAATDQRRGNPENPCVRRFQRG